jgi:hypothetical protein
MIETFILRLPFSRAELAAQAPCIEGDHFIAVIDHMKVLQKANFQVQETGHVCDIFLLGDAVGTVNSWVEAVKRALNLTDEQMAKSSVSKGNSPTAQMQRELTRPSEFQADRLNG